MELSTVVCPLLCVDIPPWILEGGSVQLGTFLYIADSTDRVNLAVYATWAIILLSLTYIFFM